MVKGGWTTALWPQMAGLPLQWWTNVYMERVWR